MSPLLFVWIGLVLLSRLDLLAQPELPALEAAPPGFRVVAERSYRDTDEPAAFATRLMEADGDLQAVAGRLTPLGPGWSRAEISPAGTVCRLREVGDATIEVHHVVTAFPLPDAAGRTRVLEVRSTWLNADATDLCDWALNFVDLDDLQWLKAQARESSTSAPSARRSTRSARSISDGS